MRCFFGLHCWHTDDKFKLFEKVKVVHHGPFGEDVKESLLFYWKYFCCYCGKEMYDVSDSSHSYSGSDL